MSTPTPAVTPITYELMTMCMIRDHDQVLLINRPNSKGFPGFIAPGGKVEYPESLTEAAIREVYEETGLTVSDLVFKGIDEFMVPQTGLRYMVFNYLATLFEGELLTNPPEGELHWVPIDKIDEVPMQPWFRRRFPLFFEPGTFEISIVWDEDKQDKISEKIKQLG
ncbi:8-oxo-dGTP diphosphatase [Brevibacillus reuszeri]|uniref:8-oxo-dGTP diphosphatase n=1 Tax=Brevibacillus reuszeri TaxID=54915 RepID=UPI000CCC96B9|nr:8-oxo-dGTP diphosphatase [Brevibacillus reuszeri]